MNASRTGSSFLCSRAAEIGLFYRDWSLSSLFTLRRSAGGPLNHKRLWLTSQTAPDDYPQQQQPYRDAGSLQKLTFAKSRKALVAETSTGPRPPAQTNDRLTTLGTKIWTVIREERQSPRIIGDLWQLCRVGDPSMRRFEVEKLGLSNRIRVSRVRNQHV